MSLENSYYMTFNEKGWMKNLNGGYNFFKRQRKE